MVGQRFRDITIILDLLVTVFTVLILLYLGHIYIVSLAQCERNGSEYLGPGCQGSLGKLMPMIDSVTWPLAVITALIAMPFVLLSLIVGLNPTVIFVAAFGAIALIDVCLKVWIHVSDQPTYSWLEILRMVILGCAVILFVAALIAAPWQWLM